MAMIRNAVGWYTTKLYANPFKVQVITATGLGLIGDMIGQHVIEGKPWEKHDWIRTLRFSAFGPLIWVPLSSRWILFAEKRFPIPPTRNLFLKVGIDQFGLGTLLTLIAFHYNELLSGHTMKDVQNKIEAHFWITMKTAWSVWIPAQLFNFYFMPLHYRVVFVQCVALGWNCYMSWILHAKVHKKELKEE